MWGNICGVLRNPFWNAMHFGWLDTSAITSIFYCAEVRLFQLQDRILEIGILIDLGCIWNKSLCGLSTTLQGPL